MAPAGSAEKRKADELDDGDVAEAKKQRTDGNNGAAGKRACFWGCRPSGASACA